MACFGVASSAALHAPGLRASSTGQVHRGDKDGSTECHRGEGDDGGCVADGREIQAASLALNEGIGSPGR